MEYPDDCKTIADKMEYLELYQEKLRLYHNTKLASATQAERATFYKDFYEPLSNKIINEILSVKKSAGESTRWDIVIKE